jgi:hypothetical protein
LGALFSRPKPQPPARMPDAEDPRVMAAERKRRNELSAGSGRVSTILSRGSGSAGGTQAYSSSLLGAA